MTFTLSPAASPSPHPASVAVNASVFLPKEHGSWSLAFEPLVLGLLVAPSSGGVALAGAMSAAFFARRPLKAAFGPTPGSPGGGRAAVLLTACAVVGLGETMILGGLIALWPLLLTAACGGWFGYFDAQGDSRAAAAELAGSAAFAFLPAAFATLAGWPTPAALALVAISISRSVPTVLTVRTYLRLRKGKPATSLAPLLAASLGFIAIVLLAAVHQIPWLTVCGAGLLLARTGWFVTALRPAWTAKRVGMVEAFLGAVYVTSIAIAYHAQ